ncbi:hypothetical protein PM082_012340 [Marasmius tenuissimus]|nr:hypothetical protein PM082_012340 [Marasmius tenuissimus]
MGIGSDINYIALSPRLRLTMTLASEAVLPDTDISRLHWKPPSVGFSAICRQSTVGSGPVIRPSSFKASILVQGALRGRPCMSLKSTTIDSPARDSCLHNRAVGRTSHHLQLSRRFQSLGISKCTPTACVLQGFL